MDSLDSLFRNEILEDLEEDTIFDDDNSLVEAAMSEHELDMLDEAESIILEGGNIEDFLDLDENDELDDFIDMEDITHE